MIASTMVHTVSDVVSFGRLDGDGAIPWISKTVMGDIFMRVYHARSRILPSLFPSMPCSDCRSSQKLVIFWVRCSFEVHKT